METPIEAAPSDLPEGPPAWRVVAAAISCSRQIVHKIDRALAAEGLTWAQLRALNEIHESGGWIHAASVARRTGVSRQAASALFTRLDQRGCLTWLDEDWIRSVRLTASGERALSRGWLALADIQNAIDRLSVEERRAIVSADESLRRELRRPPPREPWYWQYLPAHLRRESSVFEW
jgi:DNA-binding MarR family transcriptional regulator